MKILFIGDITGKPGRDILNEKLPGLRRELKIDFVIANGENMAHGTGITYSTLKECETSGIDFFTSGNHIYRQSEIIQYLEDDTLPLIRPANYPDYYPGKGYSIIDLNGIRILIINLSGQVFMGQDIGNPFYLVDNILLKEEKNADIKIVDMHGEATSEKKALGYYLDGRVNAVLGTHTHVQTADESIMKKGTAYITDVGMTGPFDSVLWVKPEISIEKSIRPYIHYRYEMQEEGPKMINAVVLEIDDKNFTTKSINRLFNIY